uniref:Uncharacterized protein n=1 Tax=Knipowitschia caucasica TaxID=637954 RepID=A0AAV2MDM4_KNICA
MQMQRRDDGPMLVTARLLQPRLPKRRARWSAFRGSCGGGCWSVEEDEEEVGRTAELGSADGHNTTTSRPFLIRTHAPCNKPRAELQQRTAPKRGARGGGAKEGGTRGRRAEHKAEEDEPEDEKPKEEEPEEGAEKGEPDEVLDKQEPEPCEEQEEEVPES